MSTTATATPIEQEIVTGGTSNNRGYKSFLKPSKFWQRSTNNKVYTENEKHQQQQQSEVEEQEHISSNNQHSSKKSFISMPTAFKSKPTDPHQTSALQEAAKAEVYKLSTVNDSGVFLPPSPKLDSKRDHWVELDEEAMAFRLPSPECLTTYGSNDKKQHPTFYTPSAVVYPRSSSVDTTTEDDVPSLMTDLSSAQSTSNVF